ncbi:hypothetical protein UFOVP158_30 [uncultured Caudovirales phage]|uniref:Uncharacterized protein n=1 Tax=uncultured Caudovirales phage TaxID=2100421 RepID=A0A6J7WAE9_9CAUD|nr:hypothetical protein UFOVP158_30 [uncultured Caudovirales phage]
MKRYEAKLSNGMTCIVVADSESMASLCVCAMLINTAFYRGSDIRVGDAYTVKEIEE